MYSTTALRDADIMQAVHSGADLEVAASMVLGYEQASIKGRAISMEAISAVATPRMSALLRSAVTAQQSKVGCAA